jgi:hypothetical protein
MAGFGRLNGRFGQYCREGMCPNFFVSNLDQLVGDSPVLVRTRLSIRLKGALLPLISSIQRSARLCDVD